MRRRGTSRLVYRPHRACGVPARLVAVYAPGLAPMDFHAVVEAIVDEQWRVVDPTLLAPRASLVRISTGRDAADTAFLTNHGGNMPRRRNSRTPSPRRTSATRRMSRPAAMRSECRTVTWSSQ